METRYWPTILWCLVQPLISSFLVAAEAATTNPSVLINMGFESKSSPGLRAKFPICDAFLKVTWIDKKKNIGYSRYEYFYDGTDARKIALALVDLDEDYPRFTYDLDIYKKHGRLAEIFSFIKSGEVYFADTTLSIIGTNRHYKNYQEDFSLIEDFSTLSHNKLNVCVGYPDGKRMWIAEGRPNVSDSALEKCEPTRGLGFFFTTDGKDIFLNNVCKVTER